MNTGADHTADYKALSILAKALVTGIILFSIVALIIHFVQGAFIDDRNLEKLIFAILLVIAAVVIIGARLIYIKRVNTLMETNQSGKEKLDIFRASTITHMVLCEMPAVLSIAMFICFGNFLLFLPVVMALVEMFMKFPTQHRIESAVNSGTF
jgi:quinol-cytochrome oxidoreductase complex cytochrome b subunit